MTPEAQRIAIAEACGWKRGQIEELSFKDPSKTVLCARWINPHGHPFRMPPDYLNDLNAMQEAEKALSENQNGFGSGVYYRNYLCHICGSHSKTVSASAPQRAEAFLRTIGKWTDL